MADYKKMYAVLCKAVDESIIPLERIPLAQSTVEALKSALLEAENIYIETSPYIEDNEDLRIIELKVDSETMD